MTEKNDIPSLLAFVRKHQEYKNESYRVDNLPYESISRWIETEQIAKGAYPVRGAALHKVYKEWCETNKIESNLIAKRKAFHSTMKQVLNFHLKNDNLFYYTSIKVNYEPQKKADQAGQSNKEKKE